MGFGIMHCRINGPATGGIDDKIKMSVVARLRDINAVDHPNRVIVPVMYKNPLRQSSSPFLILFVT
jgi:hypothetical protein